MKYIYKARTKTGTMETGVIDAYSKEAAALLLQKYNIFVTYLEEQGDGESLLKSLKIEKRISRQDLMIFFRQLSTMLESRVPVVQALSSLAIQGKKNFKKITTEISGLVQEGVPLSDALARYPRIFNNFSVNIVKSGEASGNISGSLAYVAQHLERENDIMVQLRQAMIYPIFVMGVLLVVLSIIVVEIMPRLVDLIKETNANPSFFIATVLKFYSFLGDYWINILLGLF
jgi:type IV pilus assembly protein PilC